MILVALGYNRSACTISSLEYEINFYLCFDFRKNNHLDLNIISHTRLRSNFSALIDFAIENVNFDANELRVMRQALVSNNIPTIIKTIENAQTTSANLLLDEFQLFRDTLLKRVSTKCN